MRQLIFRACGAKNNVAELILNEALSETKGGGEGQMVVFIEKTHEVEPLIR
jgi:hypothetical protein